MAVELLAEALLRPSFPAEEMERFVVEQIRKLVARGTPLQEIAVLFRAGFHSFDLEIELSRRGIPFIKVGGFKFTESAHIKDILAHLKVIAAPHDRISWNRLLLLVEGVGPKSAQRIFEAVVKESGAAAGLSKMITKKKSMAALEPLKQLMVEMDNHLLAVERRGEMVLNYYLPYLKTHFDDHPKRLRDLEHLLTITDQVGYDRPQNSTRPVCCLSTFGPPP